MATSQEEEKEQFFHALYRLDHLSEDEEPLMHAPVPGLNPPAANIVPDTVPIPRSSASAVAIEAPPPKRRLPAQVMEEVEQVQKLKRRRQQPTMVRLPPTVMSSKPSKGKKSAKFKPIPEGDQIFRGSTFYFIPNDNVAAPRKLRIQRALEYDAVWERVWSAGVTHVVVDSNLTISDVLKHFHVEKLPEGALVVNDAWLTESIGYREMRDTDAKRFRLQGSVEKLIPAVPPAKMIYVSVNGDTEQLSEQLSEQSLEVQSELQKEPASAPYGSPAVLDESIDEPGDALDAIIREMTETQDLPLDLDDDDHATAASTSFESSDSDSSMPGRPAKRKKSGKSTAQNQSMCMQKHDGSENDTSPNARTIEILQKMSSYYARVGDNWRTLAYRRCITALRHERKLIATKEEACQIPNIGERLAAKVEEIVTTHTLRRLESTTTNPNEQLLHMFMGIYQVGYPSASKWIAQGYRTLEDLKTKADLTANQRIGIEHYDDFLLRIPRAEVAQHAEIVRTALREVDPALQGIVGGSYRRGNPHCGDIDMLITKTGASLDDIRMSMLETVVPRLTESGFLKAALATGTARSDSGSKWQGACALPRPGAPWRRIDLLFVPWSELGAAMIYFTGDDIFNRSMRLLASKKGMRLNQKGLYTDVMRGQRRNRLTEGRLLEGHSEEKIFEILGVPWRPAEHRKC